MSVLYEIAFENINKSDVLPMLLRLLAESRSISEVKCTEGDVALLNGGKINIQALEAALSFKGDLVITFNLRDMTLGGVALPSVFLRLVKYGIMFDIDFNFYGKDLANRDETSAMKNLHAYAKKIAADFDVKNYFGGMEPATDTSTRYFTNQDAGPLG